MHYFGVCCLILKVILVWSTEVTFELPDNDKQCFYEDIEDGVKFDIDFQVSCFSTYFCIQLCVFDAVLIERFLKTYILYILRLPPALNKAITKTLHCFYQWLS